MSRNQREGRYIGTCQGRHLRSARPLFAIGQPDNCVAWAEASRRAGEPLPVRRPRVRYIAKALRWRYVVGPDES
jgi:hypothetical protein